jgi:hypothetical protein
MVKNEYIQYQCRKRPPVIQWKVITDERWVQPPETGFHREIHMQASSEPDGIHGTEKLW